MRKHMLRKMLELAAAQSQTLIVPELPPDTILVPSGENCTDMMVKGSAPVFSVWSASVVASEAGEGGFSTQISPGNQILGSHPRL